MNKKYLILIVVMLCLTSFAYSINNNDIIFNYGDESSGTTLIDLSGNYNATMLNGASLDNWTMVLDGTDDQIDSKYNESLLTGGSASIWFYTEDITSNRGIMGDFTVGNNGEWALRQSADEIFLKLGGSADHGPTTTVNLKQKLWYHLAITFDGSRYLVYLNNTIIINGTTTQDFGYTSSPILLGGSLGSGKTFKGNLSNAILFDKKLSTADIQTIYNDGRTKDYFEVTNQTNNFPYEQVDQLKQSFKATVTSTTPVTVLTGTFTSPTGIDAYISYSGNIQPKQLPIGDQNCFLELNGNLIEGSNVTYTGVNLDSHRSFYKLTDNFTITQASNTISVLCYGSNNRAFNVLNNVVEIHGLVDIVGQDYIFYSESGNFSVNNLTGFDTIFSRNINTTGFNVTNTNKSVFVIYDSNFQVNYDVSNTAEGYITLDDLTCPVLSRYGDAAETGSSSYLCVKNVTGQNDFNSSLYVKGDVNVEYQSFIKEVVLEGYEIKNNFVENFELNSNNYVTIDSANITIDANTKDILATSSLSISANQLNQEVILRFKIASENGSVIYRDLDSIGESGISTSQYLFTDLSVSEYEITLEGFINSTPVNVTVLNGSILYMAVGESDLNPNTFTITAQDNILNNNVQSFTIFDGVVLSTTTGSLEFPEQNSLVNLTFFSQNYFNTTVFNHNTSNNLQFNVTPHPWINFTFTEYFSGSLINNFTLTCTGQGPSTTTSNTYLIYQMPGNVTSTSCNFTSPQYASFSFNVTGLVTTSLNTFTTNVFTTNSILMTFYDESDLTLITVNVTAEVIGTLQTETKETNTSSVYFDLLSPDSYTIRYSAPGYNTNTYFLTLTNRTTNNLTLYMSLNSSSTSVTATVYDEKTQFVEDARIKVLAEDPSNPSQYITVQMCDTNFEGICQLDLILNTKQYKFIIEYPLGVIKKITNPSYIFDSSIDFQIIIGDLAAEDYVATKDVYGTVDYSSDSFTFTYNDPNNGISKACLEIYQINPTGKTLFSNSCSSSVSDTITSNVTVINGTSYLAQGFVYYNTNKIPVDEDYKSYKSAQSGFGLNGAFLILFVIITFSAIAMWNPVILLSLLPLPLTLGKFMGFIDLQWQVLLGLHFIFVVLAIMISDRG